MTPPVGRTGRAEFGRRYAIDAVNEFDPLFEDIYDYRHAQNLEVDTLIHEIGTAQMEINFLHGNPLDLADQVFLFKRTVREAAFRHGMYATFMAADGRRAGQRHAYAPERDRHRQRAQCFSNEDGSPSPAFYHFIGGLQRYLPKTMPFLPHMNSYRRLTRTPPRRPMCNGALTTASVGSACVHSSPAARRVKTACRGGRQSLYRHGASLACGYLGMVNQIDCAEPVQINAYSLALRAAARHRRCPGATQGLPGNRRDSGPRFVELYIAMKEKEFSEYFRVISPWSVNSCCCMCKLHAIHPILSQIIPLAMPWAHGQRHQEPHHEHPRTTQAWQALTPPIICIRSLTPIRSINWAAGW